MIDHYEKRLVVVAHPDDEVMWFGDLILNHPGDWTVLCMSCPRRDAIRAFLFFEACRRLGAVGQIVPFVESGALETLETLPLLVEWPREWDLVCSHGPAGDYGHLHHKQVHHAVRAAFGGAHLFTGESEDPSVNWFEEPHHDGWLRALSAYDHPCPSHGIPKHDALLKVYGRPRQRFHGNQIFRDLEAEEVRSAG